LALVVAIAAVLVSPGIARASVTGQQGIEIEGARDRRGFYIGPGLSVGAAFFQDTFVPNLRLDLALGGGVTKKVLLGVDLSISPYLTSGRGVAFGGDLEVTGFVHRGLYLRGALGAAGLPDAPHDNGVVVGIGGRFGLGYEFFLNQTVALGVGLDYDLRFVPDESLPRHGALLGVRFLWY
jgi:hypothetical protein